MGLIKAGLGALGGTLADQWKEFFYCESIPKEVLVTKGQKRITGRSSNTKGNDNIISNGFLAVGFFNNWGRIRAQDHINKVIRHIRMDTANTV